MKRLFPLFALLIAGVIPSPVAAQISVRSQLSHDETVVPGESYSGIILVRNDTDEIQQAKIYQTDYLFYADGTNYFGEPGQLDRSNAKWIELSAASMMVPPRGSVEVSYRVNVPESINGSAPSGSYWSVIMVEGVPKSSPENVDNERPDNSLGVMQVTRYGVQVSSSMENAGGPVISITESELTRSENEEATLNLAVQNAGDRLVRPDVWIELYGADGKPIGRKDGISNRLYPGTSIRQRINLGRLDPGSYRALVIMDAGDDDVFGAEYTLNID